MITNYTVIVFISWLFTAPTLVITDYVNDCIARQSDQSATQCDGGALFAAQWELRQRKNEELEAAFVGGSE